MKHVLFILYIIFSAGGLFPESSVWTISKDGRESFIGGTIHILSQSDYPLPVEYEQAYELSDRIVFETDISEVQTEEFQTLIMERLTYSDGNNLKTILSKKTYDKLEKYFGKHGIPLSSLIQFKAGFIGIIITGLELSRMGINSEGVDQYFFKRSIEDKKPIGLLETVEQQIEFLEKMGEGYEDEFILSTWEDLDQLPATMESLMLSWRGGDINLLEEWLIGDLKKEYPDLYESILINRNKRWMTTIEQMMETDGKEFFLVGTAHLAGDDGLLSMLEERGYGVEKFLMPDS